MYEHELNIIDKILQCFTQPGRAHDPETYAGTGFHLTETQAALLGVETWAWHLTEPDREGDPLTRFAKTYDVENAAMRIVLDAVPDLIISRMPDDIQDELLDPGGTLSAGALLDIQKTMRRLAIEPADAQDAGDISGTAARSSEDIDPPLIGKDEILETLRRPTDESTWRMVARLNKDTDGPIITGRGAPPRVGMNSLKTWWNENMTRVENAERQAKDKMYAREALAGPGHGGERVAQIKKNSRGYGRIAPKGWKRKAN